MNIYFTNKNLSNCFNKEKEIIRKFGPENGRLIMMRLKELKAADCLNDISNKNPQHRHQLKGNYKGLFSVSVKHPYRLIFKPAAIPPPLKDNNEIDLCKVTEIIIEVVIDYHGD